ncbi:VOC family protein [Psychromarinibacter halotolerans]|uniref:VOC family protein n=1 Tax=Psychromarinibacter halotolerans TaxID=1775175 RepID=A0ABV7GQS1_9RHOB|nr:VOC family protein [Psychromarinibacter halotolerans]MDF0597809.1 VOC family protein [Psychromarinibacter halotolerans]
MSTQPTVVWTEIPVSDLSASIAFYNAVFDWNMEPMEMAGETVAAFGQDGIGGNLVEGAPGAGSGTVIHLLAPGGLAATRARAEKAGAKIEGDEMMVRPGRYVIVHDPDGNRLGLFEPHKAA